MKNGGSRIKETDVKTKMPVHLNHRTLLILATTVAGVFLTFCYFLLLVTKVKSTPLSIDSGQTPDMFNYFI